MSGHHRHHQRHPTQDSDDMPEEQRARMMWATQVLDRLNHRWGHDERPLSAQASPVPHQSQSMSQWKPFNAEEEFSQIQATIQAKNSQSMTSHRMDTVDLHTSLVVTKPHRVGIGDTEETIAHIETLLEEIKPEEEEEEIIPFKDMEKFAHLLPAFMRNKPKPAPPPKPTPPPVENDDMPREYREFLFRLAPAGQLSMQEQRDYFNKLHAPKPAAVASVERTPSMDTTDAAAKAAKDVQRYVDEEDDGGCRRFVARNMFSSICANCAKDQTDAGHFKRRRCLHCGKHFKAAANDPTKCLRHTQGVIKVATDDGKILYAYRCCPNNFATADTMDKFVGSRWPHGAHE
eukprot:CAMPEP_0181328538 /NCGR_PEP_ID=MMETSP1101-20121128/22782_1 /TAXON_ID=46948 /ORGANISM="Rhodomonas abbreviata, Strain Caron Lab Isolate" /LENGTH=345 /DNA_ID=CAMNT_0023437459 /DNA_START=98 /DNA_END=1135 /DNA_ORIENTATION=-